MPKTTHTQHLHECLARKYNRNIYKFQNWKLQHFIFDTVVYLKTKYTHTHLKYENKKKANIESNMLRLLVRFTDYLHIFKLWIISKSINWLKYKDFLLFLIKKNKYKI